MNTVTIAVHPWERAGLGHYPYKFLGASREVYQAIPGDPSCPLLPGASCDYCAQGIYEVYRFRSADGRAIKVGCDCMRRGFELPGQLTDEQRALARDPQYVKAMREVRRIKREATHKRQDARVEAAAALLDRDDVREALSGQIWERTATWNTRCSMLERVQWLLENAGRRGKVEAAKIIEAAAKGGQS